MKQHIDFDQWNDLTEKQKLKLDTWLMGKFYVDSWKPTWSRTEYVPKRLMTIGEMIDFLAYHELPRFSFNGGNAMEWWGYNFKEKAKPEFLGAANLCDKLWEAIKRQL